MNKRKPTFVLAVLLHHGNRKYKRRKLVDWFPGLHASCRRFVDDIRFVVIDLNKITDGQILKKLGGSIMACVLLALKNAHEPKYFEQNFSKVFNFKWFKYNKEQIDLFIKSFFSYLETVTNMTTQQILEKADKVSPEMLDMIQNFAPLR